MCHLFVSVSVLSTSVISKFSHTGTVVARAVPEINKFQIPHIHGKTRVILGDRAFAIAAPKLYGIACQ